MAAVAFRNIRKSYGATEVVHGVDIDIPDGKFVVLVGPSGCGKSTLLKMLAGLERITAGEVRIGDRVVNDVPPRGRDIAMVFQNYALYPHMTVAQNMGFALKMRHTDRAETLSRVGRAADILGLQPYLARFPRHLSGGQRQRVAMGRAIVRDPQVFLFDEPLSNLDAKLRVQMRAEIKLLHQRLKTTTVYVTHDQVEAMTMADIIVVLRDGVVEQVGRPLELYDRPVNRFVAGFIGSPAMNFLPALAATGAGTMASTDAGIVVALPSLPGELIGRSVTCGVRPENFVLDPGGIAAEVLVVEPTGAEEHVVLRLGPHEITAVFRDRIEVDPGATIRISPRPGSIHLFDAESGQRLTAMDRKG